MPLGVAAAAATAGPTRFQTMCRCGIHTLPRLVAILLVAVTQLPLALAALGGLLLGLCKNETE